MARTKMLATNNSLAASGHDTSLTVQKLSTSPCCKQCKLLPDNTCGGCFRTLQEIATWGMMTPHQREAVRLRLESIKGMKSI